MMRLWSKKSILVIGMAAALVLMAGCGGTKENFGSKTDASQTKISGKVTASGSTALLPLLKAGQEEFTKLNDKVTVNISGGGSFTGQKQVASGAVNIGNSDVAAADDLKGQGLVEHKLVGIPFVFITNKDVAVDNLTKAQYADILTGKIKNWKDVGGKDEKITLIHRAKSSGSRATIAKVVLNKADFTDDAIIQDSNGAVRGAIAATPGAIGYVDAAYADSSVKSLKYNGVAFSTQAVIGGQYPVYTYGRMFTKGEATGAVKAFIDFVTSKDFQEKFAEKSGFVPITKMH